MAEETPSQFRFSADDPDPETFYHEELRDLRIEKLSQRIMLMAILLPILIAVALFFAYRDLTGRLSQNQDVGYTEIQRISRELEEISKNFNDKLITFSTTLSSQDKDFDTTVSGKLAAVDKKVAALNKNVDTLNKSFKTLDQNLHLTRSSLIKVADSKADKKNLDAATAKINDAWKLLKKELKSMQKLQNDLKKVSSGIKKMEAQLNRKLDKFTTSAGKSRKDFSQLEASLVALAAKKIDRDTFDLEVLKLKKSYQNRLAEEIAALNRQLEAIQAKIDGGRVITPAPKKSMKSLSKKTSPAASGQPAVSGADKAATSAGSGSIAEQDLPE